MKERSFRTLCFISKQKKKIDRIFESWNVQFFSQSKDTGENAPQQNCVRNTHARRYRQINTGFHVKASHIIAKNGGRIYWLLKHYCVRTSETRRIKIDSDGKIRMAKPAELEMDMRREKERRRDAFAIIGPSWSPPVRAIGKRSWRMNELVPEKHLRRWRGKRRSREKDRADQAELQRDTTRVSACVCVVEAPNWVFSGVRETQKILVVVVVDPQWLTATWNVH